MENELETEFKIGDVVRDTSQSAGPYVYGIYQGNSNCKFLNGVEMYVCLGDLELVEDKEIRDSIKRTAEYGSPKNWGSN